MYCFEKISGIIHITTLLIIPFTEYPSSPSLCIYVGNKQEVGYAEMCVLHACYVGSEDIGNFWSLCILNLSSRESFYQDVICSFVLHFICIQVVKLCKDVCHSIWLMHYSYGLIRFVYIASTLVSPLYLYSDCVWI